MSGDATFGLYPSSAFTLTTGADAADVPRQPRWYFEHETIAVPRAGMPVASFARGTPAFDDVRAWASTWRDGDPVDFPPLVLVGARDTRQGARMSGDGRTLDGLALRLVAKIPLNRAYFDTSSSEYLARHPLTVRGTLHGDDFEMRTVWPDDFALAVPPPVREAPALRTLMRETPRGGSEAPFASWTLWRRDDAPDWSGRPVVALMVNGAQGDDDEAHAGHFAIVTGRVREDGRIGDWLVNNFYTLDSESEKGIVAAPVPLDVYLGDLNSGQGWYRPSYLLVMVLHDVRAAALVQSALGRVYRQFYRHQLAYYHPASNCTSISVDTLRALGWPIPARGPTSRVLAWIGFPWMVLRERSVAKAKIAFDYMVTDRTRLFPAAAMEDAYASVRAFVDGAPCEGRLGRMLASDVDALAFLRLPQFPSSRVFGDAPVDSLAEYQARLPKDRTKLQIVPVPPRPFPDALRDDDLLTPPPHASDIALRAWGAIAAAGIAVLAMLFLQR